jgi:hypothetical protein
MLTSTIHSSIHPSNAWSLNPTLCLPQQVTQRKMGALRSIVVSILVAQCLTWCCRASPTQDAAASAEVVLGWVWMGATMPDAALVSVRVNSTGVRNEQGAAVPLAPGWRLFASAWSTTSFGASSSSDDVVEHKVESAHETDPDRVARLIFTGLFPQTKYQFEIKARSADGKDLSVRMGNGDGSGGGTF